jgi:hypothetical protein
VLPDLAPRVRGPRDAEHVLEGHRHLEPGQVAGGLGAERATPRDGTGYLVAWFHDGAIVAEGRLVGQRARLQSLDDLVPADSGLTTALHLRHDVPPPGPPPSRHVQGRAARQAAPATHP